MKIEGITSMTALQIISKILETKDYSIITNNLLDVTYFTGYEEEFNFIKDHYEQYGTVPDKSTFNSRFGDIKLLDVQESDEWLVDTIREEDLYRRSVPVIQKAAELLKVNSNEAVEYIQKELPNLQPQYRVKGTDIIHDSTRLKEFAERANNPEAFFFTTGLEELDAVIHKIKRGNELLVIVARTNQGKSWMLAKICTHVWQIGFNVGYISPEMSPSEIAYRFDTLYKNYSNSDLLQGRYTPDNEDYPDYILDLAKNKNQFIVSTPLDFAKKITISKLRNYVKQYNLDLLAIDGITYLTDERYKRGDNKTTSLTNISEDLKLLSLELGVPILVVVQANRGGVIDKDSEGTPELENIKDSDGIGHNATKVISLRQKEEVLEVGIKKLRDAKVGGKLKYNWNIDKGEFQYIPSYDSAEDKEVSRSKVTEIKKRFDDKSNVF